jgi:predicted HTH transcriptional regulator
MHGDLASLVSNGREERSLEYKRSMKWTEPITKAKVVKSTLAMANLRDGGTLLFGVEEQNDTYLSTGMSRDDYDSFNQDEVSVEVNNFADPFVELVVVKQEIEGRLFVGIRVREFQELPVICRRDGPERLRVGALYVRPRRKHETVEVPSQVEMREILDLALEKKVRLLYHQVERMGAALTFPKDRDVEAFDEQLGEL